MLTRGSDPGASQGSRKEKQLSSVRARFRLDKVTRVQGWYKTPGSTEAPHPVESAMIRLNAVQGEPFGPATPTGLMEMTIMNPAASQVFFDSAIGTEFDIQLTPIAARE